MTRRPYVPRRCPALEPLEGRLLLSGGLEADAGGQAGIQSLPALSIDDVRVDPEGDSGAVDAVFTVSLSETSAATVTVEYETLDGSAASGADYGSASGTLTFDPGQQTGTIAVPVCGDTEDEDDETFTVQLSSAAPATIADHEGICTIVDDDPNACPRPGPDVVVTYVDSPVATHDLLANDIDPEGQPIEVVHTDPPSRGTLTYEGNGRFTYVPEPGFAGTDTFRYMVADPRGCGSFCTVTVRVQPPEMLKDIRPGGENSYVSALTNANGTLFFRANDGEHGTELWRSDGTAAGTYMVKDIGPGSSSLVDYVIFSIGQTVFFAADDGVHGPELWRSDGTEAGTRLVKDIWPGADYASPQEYCNLGGTLFFRADDGIHGPELWRSDGTEAGTFLVKDIWPGGEGSYPDRLIQVDGTLFFAAADETHGGELWRSDGTEAGTVLVKDIHTGEKPSVPDGLTEVNGTLFFAAADETHGYELWRSDGTEAGTVLVKDIWPGVGSSGRPYASWPLRLTNVNGVLLFTAHEAAHGRELWRSDGTEAGTVLVKDIQPGSESVAPASVIPFTQVNGTVFFAAEDEAHGQELWRSDGTEAGTFLLKDIRPGAKDGYPQGFYSVNGTLFFKAVDGTHGYELWRSDGTAEGTRMVADIGVGEADSYPQWLEEFNGWLAFAAFGELWILHDRLSLVPPADPDPYQPGQTHAIRWFGGEAGTTLDLWALTPVGWDRAAADLPVGQGSFDWDTTGLPCGWYCFAALGVCNGRPLISHSPRWVRLAEAAGQGQGMQSTACVGAMGMEATHAFDLTWLSPAAGDTARQGQPFELRWEVELPAGDNLTASLWAYSAARQQWTRIADGLALHAGSYLWDTTGVAPGAYRFRLQLSNDDSWDALASSDWLEVLPRVSGRV